MRSIRLSWFAVLLIVSLLVAACRQQATPTPTPVPTQPPTPKPVTIEVYYPVAVDAPIAQILQGYADKFQQEYPHITVKPVFSGGYGDVKTTIQTTVEGGGKPPALAVMLAVDLYDLVNADLIVPLDDYLNAMPDKDAYLNDFIPAFLENSYYDGKIWSLPFQRSVVTLYYNKTLFDEAGLNPPASWEQWGGVASRLTKREGDQVVRWGLLYPSGWPYWLFQPLAIGNGRNIVGDDPTEVYFDDPRVIEAVQFYIDLSKKYKAMPEGVQANWGQAPGEFAKGTAAMIMHSSGSLAGILKQADFEVGVMAVPGKKPGTFATVPGGGNLYILKGASKEEQDAAWEFIKFLTRPEYVADFSINTGYIATRNAAYDTPAMKDHLQKVPQAAQIRENLQYAGKEFAVQNLGEVRNIFHKYLQAAYNGEMTPEEAMKKAQEEAEKALAPFK